MEKESKTQNSHLLILFIVLVIVILASGIYVVLQTRISDNSQKAQQEASNLSNTSSPQSNSLSADPIINSEVEDLDNIANTVSDKDFDSDSLSDSQIGL
jgi:uncharacterized protein HemX